MKLFIHLHHIARESKTKKATPLLLSEVIEVENSHEPFESYCEEHGILHNFFSPRTPQQNGVVERKNKTLQKMVRTILNENELPKYFWAETVNIACYVVNIAHILSILKITPYELWKGRLPNISYFHAFECKCFFHNNGKETLGKFGAKSDESIFLGYSSISKTSRVFNKRLEKVEESIHIIFYETNRFVSNVEDDDNNPSIEDKIKDLSINDKKAESSQQIKEESKDVKDNDLPKEWKYAKSHLQDLIIGDASKVISTRSYLQ